MNPSDEPRPISNEPFLEDIDRQLKEVTDHLRAKDPHYDADCTAKAEGRLIHRELFWRDHYHWLREKGYVLRPRYHPEWLASGKSTECLWSFSGEGKAAMFSNVRLDATRILDGSKVVLKKVSRDSSEAHFVRLLSSSAHSSNPHNRCVPVYEVLEIPDDEETLIYSMPYLRRCSSVNFETVGEVVEFVRQMLEGLEFMHSLRIAHNDVRCRAISCDGIMMDSNPLYGTTSQPGDGWDTAVPNQEASSRTLHPVKYYFTDLEAAKQYGLDDPHGTERRYRFDSGESMTQEEYAFSVDVGRLGLVFRHEFTEGLTRKDRVLLRKKRGLDFLKPLLQDMCHDNPTKRPTMKEVVARFEKIVDGLSGWRLRSRVLADQEPRNFAALTVHWARQVSRIARCIPAIPAA